MSVGFGSEADADEEIFSVRFASVVVRLSNRGLLLSPDRKKPVRVWIIVWSEEDEVTEEIQMIFKQRSIL